MNETGLNEQLRVARRFVRRYVFAGFSKEF
jgi:hypothetical protein